MKRRASTPGVEVRQLPGFPDYFVDETGRVYSAKRGGWRELRPSASGTYDSVSLCRAAAIVTMNVHRAVALAFLGEPGDADVVRHLDGNPRNNALSNLAYGTYADNEADKARHGRRLVGSNVHGAKLTEQSVGRLRSEYLRGVTLRELAVEFDLDLTTTISAIHGRTWAHVPVPDYSSRTPVRPRGALNRGQRHGNAKLTEETAAVAIEQLATGVGTDAIATDLGVSRSAIAHIAACRTWKHLPRPQVGASRVGAPA